MTILVVVAIALKVEFPLLAVDVHDVCLLDLVCIFRSSTFIA